MSAREENSELETKTVQPVKTFFMLRRLVWVLGIVFVALLPVLSCFDSVCVKSSYSAYYHVNDGIRNVFVGLLFAVSACLFSYKGFDKVEDTWLDAASVFAVFIALCPTRMDGAPSTVLSTVHNGAAVLFFVCIAVVALRPQRHLLNLVPESGKLFERRQFFITSYRVAARVMLAGPIAAVVLTYALGRETFVIWGVELLVIVAFSYYWSVKNKELAVSRADEQVIDHKVPPSQPKARGEIRGVAGELLGIRKLSAS